MNRDELIVSHFHLIEVVVDEYLSRKPKWKYLREEMISLGGELIILCADKEVQSGGHKKSTFRSYFSLRMRGKIKDTIRKELKRLEREVPYKEGVFRRDFELPHDSVYGGTEVLDLLETVLSEDDMVIVNQHLTGSLSELEVANELGIKKETLRKRKKVLKKRIKSILELEGELIREKLR